MSKIYKQVVYTTYSKDGQYEIKLSIDADNNISDLEKVDGCIEITSINTGCSEKRVYWDNLQFFIYGDKQAVTKDCEEDLEAKNMEVKGYFKAIKTLLKSFLKDHEVVKELKKGA